MCVHTLKYLNIHKIIDNSGIVEVIKVLTLKY